MNIKFNHSKWKEYDFNDIFTEYSKNNTENLEQFTVGKYGLTTKLTDTCSYNIQNHKVFEPNTLLIGIGAEEVGISVTEQGCVSPIYNTFKISNNFDSLFLKYLMPIIILQNKYKISHISTRRDYEIETSKLSKIKILLPSFEIQKEISRLLSLVDNKIENQDRTLTKLKQLKQSLLELLFPSNSSNYPQLRFKNFTSPWEQCKFGDLTTTRRGLTYNLEDIAERGIRVLRSSNIDNDTFIYGENDVFVNPDAVNIPKVKTGDILITSANGSVKLVGKHSIIKNIPNGSAVHGGFMLVASSEKPEFVNASMGSSWYSKFIRIYASGGNGAIGNLNKSDLDSQKLLIPSGSEQSKIGLFFKHIDDTITLHQCKCI